ncbi:hypothetical protein L2725_12360 [Shewanella corallii]|uniref:Uncharacterized protein n=2 Tax=Shewanella TaxID=22 RepID=A0ABT0N8Y6_9GAMM|nr:MULTISPECIES: hypothetical protein [Shewanella]MCL1038451.1 hypothetical protein [Shewanella submarina]MCL2914560.1 hypothetical protein [Shewanella corallii]
MICPHCSKGFSIARIENQRGKGLKAEFQCPHCHAWLGKNVTLQRLKITGFYVAAGMAACYWWLPQYKAIAAPVGIVALILLLASHIMDHIKVRELPPEEQDKA